MMNGRLLRQLLSIPSPSGREHQIADFIEDYCNRRKWDVLVDEFNNVFITKGNWAWNPCLVAHIDTVFTDAPSRIVRRGKNLIGLNAEGARTGLGADDKAGVFICLELLRQVSRLKVALFAGEELNCAGARACDSLLLFDVGYFLEFDAPGTGLVSRTSNGIPLFEERGRFKQMVSGVLGRHGFNQWQHQPITDVSVIGPRKGLSSLNLSAGYYAWHSPQESIHLPDVAKSIALGRDLIATLGNEHYPFYEVHLF
jgi:tripeptide aminopeptidase